MMVRNHHCLYWRVAMSSNINMRRILLSGIAGAAILISATLSYASDQGTHSCRDDSAAATKDAAKPIHTSESKAAATRQHSVLLSWDAPAGVVKGYIILRKELPKDNYSTISLVPIRETSCTDYDLVAGHTYLYQARSVGVSGRVSVPSNQVKATIRNP